jgi:predicted O-methyltransferase YrrM
MRRWAAALAATLLLHGCGCAAAAPDGHGPDAGDEVQSMLGALLESMSFAISQLYADRYDFLRTRAWYGNSHIGNRPIQARAYYDLARSVQPGTICEVGFNGGHSAAVFLSAAGRRAKMVSFDLAEFEYSETAQQLVGALYPDQLRLIAGRSETTVPRFSKRHGRACDLFSVDGCVEINQCVGCL